MTFQSPTTPGMEFFQLPEFSDLFTDDFSVKFQPENQMPISIKTVPKKTERKKSQPKSVLHNTERDAGRIWKTVSQKEEVRPWDFKITQCTRLDPESTAIWPTLYSSLKYQFFVTVSGFEANQLPFLVGKISLVNADAPYETLTLDYKGNPVLSGDLEATFLRVPNQPDQMRCKLTVKCGYLTYKRYQSEFCFQIHLFDGSQAKAGPVAIFQSPQVKIYARKPNRKRGEKRKRADNTNVQPKKRLRGMTEFEKRLDELLAIQKKIDDGSRQEDARSMLARSLLC